MNWDSRVSSILSAADGSVAKMRERLSSPGRSSRAADDVFPVLARIHDPDLDLPPPPPPPPRPPSLSSGVQWTDLASVQSQLQLQSQAIQALTLRLRGMELERESQHDRIQMLQDQVQALRGGALRGGALRGGPEADGTMEQWRREVWRELSSMRGKLNTSLGNQEDSFSSRLRREELQLLRREVEQLKTRCRRQEEDVFQQQDENRETHRLYQRCCQTVDQLSQTYSSLGSQLSQSLTQVSQTQQEVGLIRKEVSQLRAELQRLPASSPLLSAHNTVSSPLRIRAAGPDPGPDSDSEDFSPTASLAEVSSDDLSWLDHKDPGTAPLPQQRRVRLSVESRRSDLVGPGSDLEDDDDGGADEDDVDDDDDDDVIGDDDDVIGDDDDVIGEELSPDSCSDLSVNDL